jgi:hypothetical protein
MRAQTESSMQEQEERQRAGNQQQIVKPALENYKMKMRLDKASVGRVKRAANEEQGVTPVAKPLHKRARMINPKPSPMMNLKRSMLM